MLCSRRQLLVSSALAAPFLAFALSGCAGTNAGNDIQLAAQDAETIALALKNSVNQLLALNLQGLTSAVAGEINAGLDQITAAASALSVAVAVPAAQNAVQSIETGLNSIVDSVAAIPLPPAIRTVFQAAAVLLPTLEAAVGLAASQISQPATAAALTPDQALAVLKTAARQP